MPEEILFACGHTMANCLQTAQQFYCFYGFLFLHSAGCLAFKPVPELSERVSLSLLTW